MVQLAPPAAGPFGPIPVLTYNGAECGNTDEYPAGWSKHQARLSGSTGEGFECTFVSSGFTY